MTKACLRCGVRREVNVSRDAPDLCLDCRLVESDLAAMHGTWRGVREHRTNSTLLCAACLAFTAVAASRRRRRKGICARPPAKCGTRSGWRRHMRESTDPCAPCRAAHAAYMRDYRARKAGRVAGDGEAA